MDMAEQTHEAKEVRIGETVTAKVEHVAAGYFDIYAYQKFNDGVLEDYLPSEEDLEKGFATIPQV